MLAVYTKVVTITSAAKPNFFWGGKNFVFKQTTVFCSGHCLSKHKLTRYAGHGPLVCAYGCKKKERAVLT